MENNNPILLELQYLPPIQYFTKFVSHHCIFIEQHEHYIKGTYRNRCHIAGVNGLQRMSIPLKKGKNQQQSIRDVQISYDKSWQSHHWHSIKSAYGNSPYFEYYADKLQPFFKKKYELLVDWNLDLLMVVKSCLSIDCEIKFTEEYVSISEIMEKNKEGIEIIDFRNGIHPKKHRQKEDSFFKQSKYVQVFEEKNGFLPNLSILDLLFCAGPEAVLVLENSIPA